MGDAFRVNFYRLSTETGIENRKTGTEINQMSFLNTLSETERTILEFIMEDFGITQKEIAQKIGMSKNGIRYAMDKLKERGILEREEATKGEMDYQYIVLKTAAIVLFAYTKTH